jgi:membrane protein required for beta-lactamase induction
VNFIALLLGLGVERLLTQLFHLREFRWLDPLFDMVFRIQDKMSRLAGFITILLFTALIVAPVALISIALAGALYQIPYLALAVFVLLFSLGPRDLKEEVDDYCAAADNGSNDAIRERARELIEDNPPDDFNEQITLVQRAVFIQANNRIFGVVFWFLVLGPAGAWLFRVLDLMRRRLAFRYGHRSEDQVDASIVWIVRSLHGIFAWVPARLLAAGYSLAGSFDDALTDWRKYTSESASYFFEATNNMMASIGRGALGYSRNVDEEAPIAHEVRDAMNLVNRTLWLIWCPVIAVLTLSDWLA